MSPVVRELTQPAEADASMRRFTCHAGTHEIQIQALFLDDVSLMAEPPELRITGNVATNQQLGLALLTLAQRLLCAPGANLPEA